MSRVTNKVEVPYTQVPNSFLNDPSISFQEKGLLSYMLQKASISADWDFSANRIAKDTKEAAGSIRKALNGLIQAGYLIQHKLPTGKINYSIVDPNNQIAKEPDYQRGNQATLSNKESLKKKEDINKKDKKVNQKEQLTLPLPVQDKKPSSIALPSYIDQELWDDFMDLRKSIKAKNTPRATKLLLEKLDSFERAKAGAANAAIEASIESSWKSVFEPKDFMRQAAKTKKIDKNNIPVLTPEEFKAMSFKEQEEYKSAIKASAISKEGDFQR